MKVVVFGASGMVGQSAVRACSEDPGVESILLVGRSPSGLSGPKIREIVHPDLGNLEPIADELGGLDACLFCLGISSSGMTEAAYTKVTYELTMAAARVLVAKSPELVFLFVSGQGTDSTEKGKTMWARVKGRAENALLGMPFRDAYMLRPGIIQPLHGIRSRTRAYRIGYIIMWPFMPLIRLLGGSAVVDTDELGRAMVRVARSGAPMKIIEARDIFALGQLEIKR